MTGRRGGLAAWFALLLIVALGLHALGGGDLAAPPLHPMRSAAWLTDRDPLVATFALLRVLALGMCWYLVAATVAGVLTRWLRAERVRVVLDRLTVPLVRRIVQQAAGMSMATVLVAAPTTALAASPAVNGGAEWAVESSVVPLDLILTRAGPASSVPRSGDPLVFPWQVAAEGGGVALADEDTGAAAASSPGATGVFHLVRSGDSLWRIAFEHLEAKLGRVPSNAEIAPFWQRVTDVNRDRLVDPHDPDLILPGQELLVPPVVAP